MANTRLIRSTAIASLIFLTVACSTRQSTPAAVTPTPVASTSPEPQTHTTATTTASKVDPFASAEDKAISAANLAQNAATTEDWDLVKSKLQQAIALMKTVPANSPKRAIAQKQQAAYQRQMKIAQQKSQKLASGTVSTLPSTKGEPSRLTARTGSAPAISGRGSTLENYGRVEHGMSPDEVRSLLGTPIHQEGEAPDFTWSWESPDQKTTVAIVFTDNRVAGRLTSTNRSAE